MNFDFNKLRLHRKLKGYTQSDISSKIGISQSTYTRLERGEIYSWEKYVGKICEILKVKMDYFNLDEHCYQDILYEKDKMIMQLENEIRELKNNKIK